MATSILTTETPRCVIYKESNNSGRILRQKGISTIETSRIHEDRLFEELFFTISTFWYMIHAIKYIQTPKNIAKRKKCVP